MVFYLRKKKILSVIPALIFQSDRLIEEAKVTDVDLRGSTTVWAHIVV